MTHVQNELCAQERCGGKPNYGVGSSKGTLYCRKHAEDRMVNLSRQCNTFDAVHQRRTVASQASPETEGLHVTIFLNGVECKREWPRMIDSDERHVLSSVQQRPDIEHGDTKRVRKAAEDLSVSWGTSSLSKIEHINAGKGWRDVKVETYSHG